MAEKRETREPSGYLRVADVAELIEKTREWTYELIESGRLTPESHYVVGKGFHPVTLVRYDSVLQYLSDNFEGDLLKAKRKKAYNYSRNIRLSNLTPDVVQDIVKRYVDGQEDLEQIARTYETTARTISQILRAEDVTVRHSSDRYAAERQKFLEALPEAERRKIKRLYDQGHGLVSISRELGWGEGAHSKVKRALLAMGVRLRGRGDAATAKWAGRKQEALA